MTTVRRARILGVWCLVACSVAAVTGCGDSSTAPSPPPFEMGDPFRSVVEGDPRNQHGPAYSLRIAEPKEGTRYGQRESINVVCVLTVPQGGSMPSDLDVELMDKKGKIYDSTNPRPEAELGGGRYSFICSLTSPKNPGAYQIVAEGRDNVWLSPSTPVEVDLPMEKRVSHRRISSSPLAVRVK